MDKHRNHLLDSYINKFVKIEFTNTWIGIGKLSYSDGYYYLHDRNNNLREKFRKNNVKTIKLFHICK